MRVREADASDTAAILALLSQCELPLDGVPEDVAVLLVAEHAGRLLGSAGLELHEGDGLLRSLATSPDSRGRRIGGALCDELERRARTLQVRRLYLLTETAQGFFEKRGYRRVDRAAAPASIARSREFATVCPASAALLLREDV